MAVSGTGKAVSSVAWWGMNWREKVIVQNCGRALVKPKNQRGGVVLAP